MLAVAVLGILAAVAVPRYDRFVCKSRQVEAKTSLAQLYTAQEVNRAERSRYLPMALLSNDSREDGALGFSLKGQRR